MDRLEAMECCSSSPEAGSLSAASRRLEDPAGDRQPQGRRPRGATGAKLMNRTAAARPDRCRPRLSSRPRGASSMMSPRPNGQLPANMRAQGRADHHRAAGVWQAACAAGRRRIPRGLSRGRHQAGAQRPHRQPHRRTCRSRRPRSASMPDSSMVAMRVGSIGRSSARARPISPAHGRPRHPAELAGHDCISFDNLPAALDRWIFMPARPKSPYRSARGFASTPPKRRSMPRLPASG